MNSSFKQIELTITTWIHEAGDLYQYNSSVQLERQQFRSVQFMLSMPKQFQVYYFFHLINKKPKDQRYFYYLERRKQPTSNLNNLQLQQASKLILIGGIKLYKKYSKNKAYVFIQPIQASRISRVKINNKKYQQIQNNLPFLIVRTLKQGCPLKPRQLIKFGKIQFEVVELNTKNMRQVEYEFENDEIMNLDLLQKEQNINFTNKQQDNANQNSSYIAKQCKVCYMSQEDEENMLINPCKCMGSAKYIHLNCLKQWIHQKLKKMKDQAEGAFYQTNLLFCQICKQKFPKAIIKNQKVFGLLKFLEESFPYIALKSKQNIANEMQNMFYVSFQETRNIRVGRLLDNGVILEEQSVSRRHAHFQLIQQQMIVLKDQQSKYGTLVYQESMQIRLRSKMKALQIGNAVFSYKIVQKQQQKYDYYYY